MGNVVSAGLWQNPARQAALARRLAARSGGNDDQQGLRIGTESRRPGGQGIQTRRLGNRRRGRNGKHDATRLTCSPTRAKDTGSDNGTIVDSMIHDGLWDAFENFHMGNTGEIVAEKYTCFARTPGRIRAQQPPKSRRRNSRRDRFRDEIVAVPIPQTQGDPLLFDTDESPRADASIEALRALKPAFKKDGTVTAGNAPGVNDGAAAVVVTSAGARGSRLAKHRWPESSVRRSAASSPRW